MTTNATTLKALAKRYHEAADTMLANRFTPERDAAVDAYFSAEREFKAYKAAHKANMKAAA